ncbi:glycosyl hydrolase family 95 catalytic domain-containing protein [Nonomuraea endophytica]|uniref:glycosyl hydrolase family 95 catalytic domain-containing protein n=1 Tax=Nonomuraea endophytica TaxID=714136 RepID=UPI0037CB3CC2
MVRDARMVWRSLPADWRAVPLLGNGALTAEARSGGSGAELIFDVGGTGRLALSLAGTVTAVEWTLDLWNAELTGHLTTTRGSLGMSALVPRGGDALRLTLEPSAGEHLVAIGHDLVTRQRQVGGARVIVAGPARSRALETLVTDEVVTAHRAWWHSFYRRGFLSVPGKAAQRFYWALLYRAASTGPVTAAGPLYHAGGQTSPVTTGEAGWGIPGMGSKNHGQGNPIAAWDLPGRWQRYRMSMDEDVLREEVRPGLADALGFYRHFLTEGADGRLHLPMTRSPGYLDVADCTYDLALLRWAATRALDSLRLLGDGDPRAGRWREVAERLTPYPAGPGGVLIGACTPLAESHPRPSHLAWLHPLHEPGWDPGTARRTLTHWASMPQVWHGRSHAAAASMFALLDDGDEALGHLNRFLRGDFPGDSGLTPNAGYREYGVRRDDGAYAGACALLDMLVRGGDGTGGRTTVSVFPALPASWREASIAGLRTEGAFTVDAARVGGRTQWVRVRSEAGEPLVLRHGICGPVRVRPAGAGVRWRATGPGEHTLTLPAGTNVLLAAGMARETSPRDVAATGDSPRWGLA